MSVSLLAYYKLSSKQNDTSSRKQNQKATKAPELALKWDSVGLVSSWAEATAVPLTQPVSEVENPSNQSF